MALLDVPHDWILSPLLSSPLQVWQCSRQDQVSLLPHHSTNSSFPTEGVGAHCVVVGPLAPVRSSRTWQRFPALSAKRGIWVRFTFGEASSEYSCKPWNAFVSFYRTNNISHNSRHKQGFVSWTLWCVKVLFASQPARSSTLRTQVGHGHFAFQWFERFVITRDAVSSWRKETLDPSWKGGWPFHCEVCAIDALNYNERHSCEGWHILLVAEDNLSMHWLFIQSTCATHLGHLPDAKFPSSLHNCLTSKYCSSLMLLLLLCLLLCEWERLKNGNKW